MKMFPATAQDSLKAQAILHKSAIALSKLSSVSYQIHLWKKELTHNDTTDLEAFVVLWHADGKDCFTIRTTAKTLQFDGKVFTIDQDHKQVKRTSNLHDYDYKDALYDYINLLKVDAYLMTANNYHKNIRSLRLMPDTTVAGVPCYFIKVSLEHPEQQVDGLITQEITREFYIDKATYLPRLKIDSDVMQFQNQVHSDHRRYLVSNIKTTALSTLH